MARTLRFDPFAPGFRDDPYPIYARLRAENPVHRSLGHWVVTRHEDVRRVLMDRTLSVAHVPSAIEVLVDRFLDLDASRVTEFARKSIVFSDGGEHRRLRKAISRVFAPDELKRYRDSFAHVCDTIVGETMARGREADLSEFADAAPGRMLAHVFGLDEEEAGEIALGTGRIRSLLEPGAADEATLRTAILHLDRVMEVFARARRRLPSRSDAGEGALLAALETSHFAKDGLNRFETDLMAVMTYVAGLETTSALIANCCDALADRPDEQAKLRADNKGVDGVIRETLRFEAPLQLTMRTAVVSIALGGHTIQAGETILLCLGSANRDEEVFPRAESFEPGRDAGAHLAFGTGLHSCLGATLAKYEAEAAMMSLASATQFERRGPSIGWSRRAPLLRTPSSLPVRLCDA